ncbi:MAG: hypothetical protein ACJA08_002290 [Cyclobacteriaceae bacterium]|jgi:hypothetical protein
MLAQHEVGQLCVFTNIIIGFIFFAVIGIDVEISTQNLIAM